MYVVLADLTFFLSTRSPRAAGAEFPEGRPTERAAHNQAYFPHMTGTRFLLEVRPVIPERLQRLEELANDLLYSWDSQVRSLFVRLDPELWNRCGHNPKVFLRRVSQQNLEAAVADDVYTQDYDRILAAYDSYLSPRSANRRWHRSLDAGTDLVAYFCAEFGLHESFPIYSGGLGILAGDHCKAASDLGIPFVAVGLLYREGYFHQHIDGAGNQISHNFHTDSQRSAGGRRPRRRGTGNLMCTSTCRRRCQLKVWRAKADTSPCTSSTATCPPTAKPIAASPHSCTAATSTPASSRRSSSASAVRALRAVGLKPTVWHINEGHAAFLILERCRERVREGLPFDAALELVAAGTVFTTHTPVPADTTFSSTS